MGNKNSSRQKDVTPMVEVKSNEQLLSELKNLIEAGCTTFLNQKDVNVYNVILTCMSIVEQYTSTSATLTSQDKVNFALQLLPFVLTFLQTKSVISLEESNNIQTFVTDHNALILGFISVAISIANNPTVIQTKNEILIKLNGCCCIPKKTT